MRQMLWKNFGAPSPFPNFHETRAYPNCKSEAEMTSVFHTENGCLLFSDPAEEATLRTSVGRLDLARIIQESKCQQETSFKSALSGAAGSVASQGGAG